MTLFRVWAPRAERVELQVAGGRLEMTCGDGGWWQVETEAGHGTDYAYFLDDEGPFPDPRSAWQPNGVHQSSRLFDHDSFRWTDAGWKALPLGDAVIYELHIGTFTPAGTFEAAIAKLDHIKGLGVTHVEIMPVASFPGVRGWGYDGVGLFAPHEPYGGPRGLKELVTACHSRGLAVVLDVVYNHFGPSGDYFARYGPYFTQRYKTPWGEAINFDGRGSDEVRRFFIDNALMWLRDYHFDGLRLDAVDTVFDQSAVHLLEQLATEVNMLDAELGRPLVLIAESDLNNPRVVTPRSQGGYGLDAQWSDDLHHALHTVLTGESQSYYVDFGSLADIATALTKGYIYSGRFAVFRGRSHGRPFGGLSAHRLIGCLQNHDQTGNRLKGERLGHLISQARLKVGAALLLTAPFVPMLFQGEEWSASAPFMYFTDHDDDLARAIWESRQREFVDFGWRADEVPDPQDPALFKACRLDWGELEQPQHREILDWYRALLRLRAETPELRDGRLDGVSVRFDEDEQWLVVERGPIVVACNLGPARSLSRPAKRLSLVLASDPSIGLSDEAVDLPPDSVAILRR